MTEITQLNFGSASKTFGDGTPEYARHLEAATLDKGGISMGEDSPHEIIQFHEAGKAQSLALLQQVVRGLSEDLQTGSPAPVQQAAAVELSREIFIVHGRYDAAKTEVARLVER